MPAMARAMKESNTDSNRDTATKLGDRVQSDTGDISRMSGRSFIDQKEGMKSVEIPIPEAMEDVFPF